MKNVAWQLEHSVEAEVSLSFAWSWRTDIKTWDDPPARFQLDGPFASGSWGTSLLPGQKPLRWQIRDVRPGAAFTVEIPLDGAVMSFEWLFEALSNHRTRMTQRIVLRGDNAAAYVSQVQAGFGSNLADGMKRIADAMEGAVPRRFLMMSDEGLRVSAVVFDMDGLMLDTESLYKATCRAAALDLGYEVDDHFYDSLVGRSLPDSESALVRRFGAAFPLADFRMRWLRGWNADAERCGIAAKPGLFELLSMLEDRHIPTAVATSTDAVAAAFTLRAGGIEGRFQAIVSGDQVAHGKPAPDIYLEAARRLAVDPRDCIALEDSDAGVLAASRAGMRTFMVPDLRPPSLEAASAAFQVFRSLHDVRSAILALIT